MIEYFNEREVRNLFPNMKNGHLEWTNRKEKVDIMSGKEGVLFF